MGGSCLSVASFAGGCLRRAVMAAGLSSQTVDIDGDTTIHFWGPLVAAPSKPNLVLLHGFGPEGPWQWRWQITFFSPQFNVFVPDLVFFGRSFSKASERSEIFQASCVAKLLEKLRISRYSLVGTSYGGMVSYRMAKMWPERVEKVVIASSAVNMVPSETEQLMKKAKVERIEDLMLPTTGRQLRTMISFVMYRRPYMPDFVLNDFVDKLYSENRKEKAELLTGLTIGKNENVNISPLPQDVLVVWGEHDGIFPVEKGRDLHKLFGEKAKMEVIEKASHIPQIEHPPKFNHIVNDFLHGF